MMNRFSKWGVAICGTCLIAVAGCTSTISRNWNPGHRASIDDELTAQLSLARINERQGQAEQARTVYNAVLKRDPNNQMAYHRLGVMAAREARVQEAEAHFRRAAEVAPPTPELLNDMGYNFYLQDRLQEAETSFRAALEQNPHHQRANNNLGLVLGEMGRTDESLATFRHVVSESEAQSNLAYARTQAGDLRAAEAHFHRAISLDSSQRKPAEALLQLADMKSAVERAQFAQARLQENAGDQYAIDSRNANQGQLARVAYEHQDVANIEAAPARKSLFGGGVLALRDADKSSPARDASGASESRSAPSQDRGSGAVLASFSDLAPSPSSLGNSRQASHVVAPGNHGSEQLSPTNSFDRSQLGASPNSARLPSLSQGLPARVSSNKVDSDVAPQDVPMQGPSSAQRSSRRTHAEEQSSTPSPSSTSPVGGAMTMSPWQQPTWTGGATGTLQAAYSGAASPQNISNPFVSGGFFNSSQTAGGAQSN